jgi:hypothetical protein
VRKILGGINMFWMLFFVLLAAWWLSGKFKSKFQNLLGVLMVCCLIMALPSWKLKVWFFGAMALAVLILWFYESPQYPAPAVPRNLRIGRWNIRLPGRFWNVRELFARSGNVWALGFTLLLLSLLFKMLRAGGGTINVGLFSLLHVPIPAMFASLGIPVMIGLLALRSRNWLWKGIGAFIVWITLMAFLRSMGIIT